MVATVMNICLSILMITITLYICFILIRSLNIKIKKDKTEENRVGKRGNKSNES